MAFQHIQDPEWEAPLQAAWEAWTRAYAPYSGFRVGAALVFPGGVIVTGCNVENAAYPVSLCAERGALSAAIAQGLGHDSPLALVVVTEGEPLTPPCGACRQVLAEFATQLPILLASRAHRALFSLDELLPHAFNRRHLQIPN